MQEYVTVVLRALYVLYCSSARHDSLVWKPSLHVQAHPLHCHVRMQNKSAKLFGMNASLRRKESIWQRGSATVGVLQYLSSTHRF